MNLPAGDTLDGLLARVPGLRAWSVVLRLKKGLERRGRARKGS